MHEDTRFRVAIKDSARELNEPTRRFIEVEGQTVGFSSKSAAQSTVERLSSEGDVPVKLQRAAPQDPNDIDAYLIPDPERRTHEPAGSLEEGWTFDVGAKQYGEIGEALILSYRSNPPALMPFIRRDLGEGELDAELHVRIDSSPDPIIVKGTRPGEQKQWWPDCRAIAQDKTQGRTIATYFCEIKTGDASFERDQRSVMQEKASEAPVLAIRLDISELPNSYSVQINRISSCASKNNKGIRWRDTRLEEFTSESQ